MVQEIENFTKGNYDTNKTGTLICERPRENDSMWLNNWLWQRGHGRSGVLNRHLQIGRKISHGCIHQAEEWAWGNTNPNDEEQEGKHNR